MSSKHEFMLNFITKHTEYTLLETLELECPKHGPYTNYRLGVAYDDGSKKELPLIGCPKCNDEACWEASLRMTEEVDHEEKFASSKIPNKYQACMLRNFYTRDANADYARLKAEAQQKCLDFIEGRIRSIVLIGPTDRGKSHLLASMLRGCITTGRDALYVLERKIYRDIHESYLGRKDIMTEGQVIDLYSSIPVLGIDEIGRSSWTDHEAQTLYEIIDRRDADNLKTVMAGNITPLEFEKKFDASLRRKLGAYELVCRWGAWSESKELKMA